MVLIHPSCLGKIMTKPKAANEVLSVGAKTYLTSLAKEIVYGYVTEIDVKYMQKGIQCEGASINLLNQVGGTEYFKNAERRTNDILNGEADILTRDRVIDIKTAWSLSTFPATRADAEETLYEWQGRAYMYLYDKSEFQLSYCMVSTPDELIKYENPAIHKVDHIPPHLRVTTLLYPRDAALEKDMIVKCKAAQVYVEAVIEQILEEHRNA